MAFRRYSIEQLLHLRNSPLVQKPDNLPAIEQWIDESQQPQRPQRPPPREGGTSSPMGNFSAGQRPGLAGSRISSKDDVSLGPPRTIFASSRTTSRLADFGDSTNAGDASEGTDSRQGRINPGRKGGVSGSEPEGKPFRESWTSARERRAAEAEDEGAGDRGGRYGRRDRDRDHDGERRNGFGDRQDPRWGPRDDRRNNGERDRRWRSRERPRDREWDRGTHTDREPEWMEDVQDKSDGDSLALPKNQEEFEKWKQAQHARDKKPIPEDVTAFAEPVAAPATAEVPVPIKPLASLQLDSATTRTLHDWGKQPPTENTPVPKQAASKGKTSRFMPMFKKDEAMDEQPAYPTHVQKLSADIAATSSEDKEGFQRILMMLGGSGPKQGQTPTPTSTEPTSPQSKAAGGARSKSRFTGFFDQGAKSPDVPHSPEIPTSTQFQSMDRESMSRERIPHAEPGPGNAQLPGEYPRVRQPVPGSAPPQPFDQVNAISGSRDSRSASGRVQDIGHEQPQRGSVTPDVNIQNLLASQRIQRAPGPDKNSEFLLNLLQAKGSSSSRPPSQQARADAPFPLWLDQPPQASEPHAPKPRMPTAPGSFEDQLLRGGQNDVNSGADPSQRRQPQQQRAPPGFFDEQSLFLQQQQQSQQQQQNPQLIQQQQQRRNVTEPPRMMPGNGRPNGMPNMPPMQMPPPQRMPPEFMSAPPSGYMHGPPPGFNAHAPRHPPGFHNIPNIFQQREPPAPGLGMGHPNAPPRFFGGPAPPGMPPGLMPMRSGPDNGPGGVAASGGRGGYGPDGMGRGR